MQRHFGRTLALVLALLALAVVLSFAWPLAGLLVLLAGAVTALAGCRVLLPRTSLPRAGVRAVRVAVLWNGTIVREELVSRSGTLFAGSDLRSDIPVPAECGLGARFALVRADRNGRFSIGLSPTMGGFVRVAGERLPVSACLERFGSRLPVGGDDFGLLHAGVLVLFFQSVAKERWRSGVAAPEARLIAAGAASALLHVSLVLAASFLWEVDYLSLERAPLQFVSMGVDVVYATDDGLLGSEDGAAEQTEEPEPTPGDSTWRREDGVLTEADAHPQSGEETPQMEEMRVARMDPTKVGLARLLSREDPGGVSAIAEVMAQAGGVPGDMPPAAQPLARSGAAEPGSDGAEASVALGLGPWAWGTSPTGGEHGEGRTIRGRVSIHGRLVSGPPVGTSSLAPVAREDGPAGGSSGGCRRADVARRVRHRARAIRACYEERLTAAPKLRGKLVARWSIGMDGRVRSALVVSGTMGDEAVALCVVRVVRRIQFERPAGGLCVVQWPFVFETGFR